MATIWREGDAWSHLHYLSFYFSSSDIVLAGNATRRCHVTSQCDVETSHSRCCVKQNRHVGYFISLRILLKRKHFGYKKGKKHVSAKKNAGREISVEKNIIGKRHRPEKEAERKKKDISQKKRDVKQKKDCQKGAELKGFKKIQAKHAV